MLGSIGFHAQPVENANAITAKYKTVRLNPFLSFWKKEYIDKINSYCCSSKGKLFSTFNFKAGDKINSKIIAPKDGWLDAMGKLFVEYMDREKALPIFEIKESQPNEFSHFGGMSSIYRRFFRTLEDANDPVEYQVKDIFLNRKKEQIIGYWVNYYTLYELVKNDIPFEDYKKEYEKIFELNTEALGISLEELRQASNRLKNKYNGLFI